MKSMLIAAGAALLLAGCASDTVDEAPPPLAAAPAPTTAANGMPILAPGYLQMSASSDMFEIESGRLAQQMSSNMTVRSFGQMLVTDHSRTMQELMSAAAAAGVPAPPPGMLPKHADMLQRLQTTAPADFDVTFRDIQMMAHQEALMLHQTYAAEGDVLALREVAGRAVPIIQAHLNHVQTLQVMTMPPAGSGSRRAGERG